jgi:hypothetical protein
MPSCLARAYILGPFRSSPKFVLLEYLYAHNVYALKRDERIESIFLLDVHNGKLYMHQQISTKSLYGVSLWTRLCPSVVQWPQSSHNEITFETVQSFPHHVS